MSTNNRMPDKIRVDTEDLQSVRVGSYIGEDMTTNESPLQGLKFMDIMKTDRQLGRQNI